MKKLLLITTIASMTFAAQLGSAVINLEKSNQNEIHMLLEASDDVYGLQFDINYNANQISLNKDNIEHMFSNSDVRSNMSVYAKVKEPGIARVIIFDLGGQALLTSANLEKVVKVAYDVVDGYNGPTEITFNNIVAAGEHGAEVETDESYSVHFEVNGPDSYDSTLPQQTKISGNYPNPFNPTTQINFELSAENAGLVDVSVYDIQGRKVANLENNVVTAGYHSYTFDASNLSSGQYFVRITAPGFSDVKPMTLLK